MGTGMERAQAVILTHHTQRRGMQWTITGAGFVFQHRPEMMTNMCSARVPSWIMISLGLRSQACICSRNSMRRGFLSCGTRSRPYQPEIQNHKLPGMGRHLANRTG